MSQKNPFETLNKSLGINLNPQKEAKRSEESKPLDADINRSVVRSCTDDCAFRKKIKGRKEGCEYFQQKKVREGDACLMELEIIGQMSMAATTGRVDGVKEIVGSLQGVMFVNLYWMFEQLSREGLTYEEPILDSRGDPIFIKKNGEDVVATRIIEHPLIGKISQLSKTLGFDLTKFKLTPESSGEKRSIVGNITLNNANINILTLEASLNDELEKFKLATQEAQVELENDPVYKMMKGPQKVIDVESQSKEIIEVEEKNEA